MKRIFSILTLFFVLTTSAYAEHEKFNYNSQKPVTCTTPERVKDVLGNMLGELPYFQGEGTAASTDGKSFIKTKLIISVSESNSLPTFEVPFINLAILPSKPSIKAANIIAIIAK